MLSAQGTRRIADVEKLRALAARAPGLLTIDAVKGTPPDQVDLTMAVPTPRDRNYPSVVQQRTSVSIVMAARYPFDGPMVTLHTPVWNPNVYPSGKWCYGNWTPTENMELFVVRLMKVLALDPSIVNPASPANAEAAHWYVGILASNPRLFPTMDILAATAGPPPPRVAWRNLR